MDSHDKAWIEAGRIIEELKKALKEAILNRSRTVSKCIDFDPGAGSTYEIDWNEQTKRWAVLCDLDLEKHDPSTYARF